MKRSFIYLFSIVALSLWMSSCDVLEDDTAPKGEETLDLNLEKSTLPGVPVYFDLEQVFQFDDVVDFGISLEPAKGEVFFIGDAVLKYNPNQDFTEGSDMFSVSITDEQQNVLDIDTIQVIVLRDSSNVPCFNGALPEFYVLDQNESIQFDPTVNDGLCPDQITSFELKAEDPEHGEVEKVSDTEFSYTPEDNYVGHDFFFYELKLVDLEGEEHVSVAKVEFEIKEEKDIEACEASFPFKTYEIELGEPLYEFQVYFANDSCQTNEWSIDITDVSEGVEADVSQDQKFIRYAPSSAADSGDYVYYTVTLPGDIVLERKLSILFKDTNGENCAEAFADEYTFTNIQDSLLNNNTFETVLQPALNDQYCTEDFEIHILEQPSLGEAIVQEDGKTIRYAVEVNFEEKKETTIKYEICDQGKCDFEFIYLDLEP
ncbi:MAG: hypothetical protein KI790_10815 [Cyclobacteriaceae bacterium]|nr:hypothetical protein [Cyclobacteriaceae bacterium HetDA_MAG_MS6]